MSTSHDDGGEHLAPVVPLFGGPAPTAPARPEEGKGDTAAEEWHTTWQGAPARRSATAAVAGEGDGGSDEAETDIDALPGGSAPGDGEEDEAAAEVDEIARRAEQRLVRALGSRGLSEREARDRLRRDGVASEIAEDIIDRLLRVGAIDDDILAEQLVYQATNRKGQGRKAVAQSLVKRGLSRDAIDRAIESLPDDDEERALEFARSKSGPLSRLDHDTALRRLVGQLSRRGFGGSMAMRVANQALDEARGGGIRRVRFQ